MKKVIFLLAIVTIILGMSSCGKDYVCSCTVTGQPANDSLYWIVTNQHISNTSHSNAVANCNGWQTTEQNELNTTGAGGTVKCNL